MNKYRVLKTYPKHLMNSGRLVTLREGTTVCLKKEAQVSRLISLGFLKPVMEVAKKEQPKRAAPKVEVEKPSESKNSGKYEYLNKKNKGH